LCDYVTWFSALLFVSLNGFNSTDRFPESASKGVPKNTEKPVIFEKQSFQKNIESSLSSEDAEKILEQVLVMENLQKRRKNFH
jgi:hypothetical protein